VVTSRTSAWPEIGAPCWESSSYSSRPKRDVIELSPMVQNGVRLETRTP
jgi:hypothetical protein